MAAEDVLLHIAQKLEWDEKPADDGQIMVQREE
jgi:hypothetical protein